MTPQRVFMSLLTVSASLLIAAPVFAQPEVSIYRGEPIEAGMQLGGWGSGYCVQSQREFYSGNNSIELHTDGYYAGGRIDLTRPVDLSDAFADPNAYLVFMVRFPGLADEGEAFGTPVFGPSRAAPGIPPPGTGPGGGGGGVDFGEATGPAMGYFRVLITVGGVQLVASDQPIDFNKTQSGWTPLSVPLSAFKGPKPAAGNANLSRILLFGDRPDMFYVGEIRTAIDEEEIYFDLQPEEQAIFPNDLIQLTATAVSGLSNVELLWDFDKEDGIQEEGFGNSVAHSWKDPGEYIVTLRVRDINGVKPELRQEFIITVTQ